MTFDLAHAADTEGKRMSQGLDGVRQAARARKQEHKLSVVRQQIILFPIIVGGFVAIDPFPPQFLDQPILMGPVVPLHPPPRFWWAE